MLVKALKSFRGRYGLIHAGTVFECEVGYFQQLQRNGLAEKAADGEKPKSGAPGPAKNRAVAAAPSVVATPPVKPVAPAADKPENADGGKDETGEGTDATSDLPPADGAGSTSRSLRQALASRAKTSRKSETGETPKT